jgi:hypothetical protein
MPRNREGQGSLETELDLSRSPVLTCSLRPFNLKGREEYVLPLIATQPDEESCGVPATVPETGLVTNP